MKFPPVHLDFLREPTSPQYCVPYSRPLVPTYRVGEPLQRGRRCWPVGAQYSYSLNGHELTLFASDINDNLVHDLRYGEAEFAVIVEHPVLVLGYRFGDSIHWSDVPFSWHMQPAHCRVTPPLESSPETRALLWITLVGADDGIIHAQRGMTLAPGFTCILQNAIRAQASTPFDPDLCTTVIGHLFVAHPNTLSRLPLVQARTMGNQ
jgi:hypothetical protein